MRNQNNRARKSARLSVFVVMLVVLLMSTVFSGCVQNAKTGEAVPVPISNDEPVPINVDEPGYITPYAIYTPGTYEVGAEMEPGEYILIPAVRGFYKVTEELISSGGEVPAGYFEGPAILTLKEGTYLTLQNSVAMLLSNFVETSPTYGRYGDGSNGPGTYKIGVSLQPGQYTLVPIASGAYYQIDTSSEVDVFSTTDNGSFDRDVTVFVVSGMYLKVENALIYPEGMEPEMTGFTQESDTTTQQSSDSKAAVQKDSSGELKTFEELRDALAYAGINRIVLPEYYPQGYVQTTKAAVKNKMVETAFSDGVGQIIIRKGVNMEAVYGDDTSYKDVQTVIANGMDVRLEGENGLVYLALWESEGMAFAIIFTEGVSTPEAKEMAGSTI